MVSSQGIQPYQYLYISPINLILHFSYLEFKVIILYSFEVTKFVTMCYSNNGNSTDLFRVVILFSLHILTFYICSLALKTFIPKLSLVSMSMSLFHSCIQKYPCSIAITRQIDKMGWKPDCAIDQLYDLG